MLVNNLLQVKNPKVLVCYSGGIDSTVLAYYYKSLGYSVVCGIFKPDRDSNGEYEDAIRVVNSLNLDYIEIGCCSYELLKTPIRINNPNSKAIEDTKEVDFLVGWKMNMALQLLSIGSANGFDEVVFGHNKWNNHFKDELPESFELYSNLFKQVYGDRLTVPKLKNPFYDMRLDDAGIIKLGQDLKVPFEYTMSCAYNVDWINNVPVHCGLCYFCKARQNRFLEANVTDPTIYSVNNVEF